MQSKKFMKKGGFKTCRFLESSFKNSDCTFNHELKGSKCPKRGPIICQIKKKLFTETLWRKLVNLNYLSFQ